MDHKPSYIFAAGAATGLVAGTVLWALVQHGRCPWLQQGKCPWPQRRSKGSDAGAVQNDTEATEITHVSESASVLTKSLGLVPHPEGGFFLETHRSGTAPMTTKGQTGLNADAVSLATTVGRGNRRVDGDERRNWLTSIFWMPTAKSPTLWLAVNMSDHVHYYHGGAPFEYILICPSTSSNGESIKRVILGPDVKNGHKLQVPVQGGTWKAGKLLPDGVHDYCLIGEAVAPGFDFADFTWVHEEDVRERNLFRELSPYIKSLVEGEAENIGGLSEYYNDDTKRAERASERLPHNSS